jgi:hypothetical protein
MLRSLIQGDDVLADNHNKSIELYAVAIEQDDVIFEKCCTAGKLSKMSPASTVARVSLSILY